MKAGNVCFCACESQDCCDPALLIAGSDLRDKGGGGGNYLGNRDVCAPCSRWYRHQLRVGALSLNPPTHNFHNLPSCPGGLMGPFSLIIWNDILAFRLKSYGWDYQKSTPLTVGWAGFQRRAEQRVVAPTVRVGDSTGWGGEFGLSWASARHMQPYHVPLSLTQNQSTTLLVGGGWVSGGGARSPRPPIVFSWAGGIGCCISSGICVVLEELHHVAEAVAQLGRAAHLRQHAEEVCVGDALAADVGEQVGAVW